MEASSFVVYDFDQTITKNHTFGKHGLFKAPTEAELESHYRIGKQEGVTNIKSGLSKACFETKRNRVVSIATYHNNPHFIAGHLSCIFESELVFKEQLISQRHPAIVINEFSITGTTDTFLVSYIHAYEEFAEIIHTLEGKNLQIDFLQETLMGRGSLSPGYYTRFYDDSVSNLSHFIKHFRSGTAHHVIGHNHDYQVRMHQHTDDFLLCNEAPDEGICGNLEVL